MLSYFLCYCDCIMINLGLLLLLMCCTEVIFIAKNAFYENYSLKDV